MKNFRVLCALVAAVALLVSACSSDKKAAAPASGTLSGTINVLAASSLTKGFGALGGEFEAAHPGTKISFSFASSSDLETQIEQGAPADVFASADQKNMDKIVKAGTSTPARPATSPRTASRSRLRRAIRSTSRPWAIWRSAG